MTQTVILCTILALIVFAIQMVLCLAFPRKAVRFLPACLIIALYLLAVALYFFDWLDGGGGVAIGSIFAFILAIGDTVALAADLAAWAVVRFRLRKTSESTS